MALQRATEAYHPLRDERTDLFDPVRQPITDCGPAKQRSVQATAGGCHNFTPELPEEEVGAAKTISGEAFGARPFDSAPMQEIVRPQIKRALEGTVRRVLRHPAGKESKHHPGYDLTLIAREEQLPVPSRCEELFLKLLFAGDLPEPATCPVDVNGVVGRYIVTAFSRLNRDPVFYRPPDPLSPNLRKFLKQGI